MNITNIMGEGMAGQVGTGSALSRLFQRMQKPDPRAGQAQQAQYQPQSYQAPPQYQSFADLFNQPQFDQSQVTDIYQRGNMPNNLLDRYNSLMTNLQSQQAAMVPRQAPQTVASPQMPPMTRVYPRQGNPYMNFSQLFGGR